MLNIAIRPLANNFQWPLDNRTIERANMHFVFGQFFFQIFSVLLFRHDENISMPFDFVANVPLLVGNQLNARDSVQAALMRFRWEMCENLMGI